MDKLPRVANSLSWATKVPAADLLMVSAALWCLMAAWLSAKQLIGVKLEILSYWFCFPTVVVGAIVASRHRNRPGKAAAGLGWPVRGCAIVLAATAWALSDRLFLYWKTRAISEQVWSRMASSLREVGMKLIAEEADEAASIRVDMLPRTFQALGRRTEYAFGTAQGGLSGFGDRDFAAYVAYGWKSRRWGLCVGPEGFFSQSKRFRFRVRVAEDAFFFVAPDL